MAAFRSMQKRERQYAGRAAENQVLLDLQVFPA
jgi:hypothetical protein